MKAANKVRYRPPPEFQEDTRDPLVELNLTDSTELWLIQWPINQPPDFDGKEVTLNLDQEGELGSFEGPSGKDYKLVSISAQQPEATVFLSSSSGSKMVGQISRRVSIVHHPEPNELEKLYSSNQKQVNLRSSTASLMTSSRRLTTPLHSIQRSNPKSGSSGVTSTFSGRQRSSFSEVREVSKRRIADDRSTQDSGLGITAVTSSGSLEHPLKKKSKSWDKSGG
ncbi:hypothetical protein Ancab_011870 [Ancistrocladus abbreviatus]